MYRETESVMLSTIKMKIKAELKEDTIVILEQNANGWIHASLNTPRRKTSEETMIIYLHFIQNGFGCSETEMAIKNSVFRSILSLSHFLRETKVPVPFLVKEDKSLNQAQETRACSILFYR